MHTSGTFLGHDVRADIIISLFTEVFDRNEDTNKSLIIMVTIDWLQQ